MRPLKLPDEVEAVFQNFMTCEFTTLGKSGGPVSWPTLPTYWPERGQFIIASPVALAQKAVNARRNPNVSLLFSNPTGSGLERPPAVLVQGEAEAPERVHTGTADLDPGVVELLTAQGRRLMATQPGMRLYVANPLTRALMGWYFMRVVIYVTPRRVTWWPAGDFSQPAQCLEVKDVEAARALPAGV
jgi:hypothetical protein